MMKMINNLRWFHYSLERGRGPVEREGAVVVGGKELEDPREGLKEGAEPIDKEVGGGEAGLDAPELVAHLPEHKVREGGRVAEEEAAAVLLEELVDPVEEGARGLFQEGLEIGVVVRPVHQTHQGSPKVRDSPLQHRHDRALLASDPGQIVLFSNVAKDRSRLKKLDGFSLMFAESYRRVIGVYL